MFQFKLNTQIIAGKNVLDHVGENAQKFGKSVLIVTDTGVRQAGLTDPIQRSLDNIGLPYIIYDGVVSNPTVQNVEEAYQLLKQNQCDLLIAVGGGSAIDTAKSVAVVAANGGSILDYEGIDRFSNPSFPVIAVPTTIGTGAEVSSGSVMSDPDQNLKFVVISNYMSPIQAYLDQRMVEKLPASICAATGGDTLTHALEAYISLGANPMSDVIALNVIKTVGSYLRPAVAGDVEARYQMLIASCMAGMLFSSAGLGLVHALATTMGGHFNVHHGVANAVLLPHVMEFNLIARSKKFVDIAVALGENVAGLSEREAADRAVEAVRKLFIDIGIPSSLRELGINEEIIPTMAEEALDAVDRPTNPRHNNVKDLEAIYRSAY